MDENLGKLGKKLEQSQGFVEDIFQRIENAIGDIKLIQANLVGNF